MKRILGHEALVFFCSLMFGAVVLPAFTFVTLAFFGLMPRNSSLAECYDALKLLLGPHQWIFWTAVVGPYFVVQIIRVIKWRRTGGPWYVEPVPIVSGSAAPPPGTYCEFSMMTWRDGVGNFHRTNPERRDSDG